MIDESTRTTMAGRVRMSTYASGDAIIEQGQPCDRICIVVRGSVKVVHLTEDGDEQVLQLLDPGDLIGDPFGSESGVSWEAATEVTLCSMPQMALDHLAREHPSVYRAYLAGAVHELEEQRLWAAAMRGRSTLQRLAYWLGKQPSLASDQGGAIIEIALSRRDLSSLLDMSVETLCRSLHQIEQRGAIRLLSPNTVSVLDYATLYRLSSVEEELAAPRVKIKVGPRANKRLLRDAAAAKPASPGGTTRHRQ